MGGALNIALVLPVYRCVYVFGWLRVACWGFWHFGVWALSVGYLGVGHLGVGYLGVGCWILGVGCLGVGVLAFGYLGVGYLGVGHLGVGYLGDWVLGVGRSGVGSGGPVGSEPLLSRTRYAVFMGLCVGFRICASWRSIVPIPEFSHGRADTRRSLRLEIATFK